MYTHENAPELFREIFKNSFLPFKDPSTLNMFLKEIDEFHYSHSEKLGDAYEYLLSYMGSQGDAGQFRTPRHIIDFIVEIVDPKKSERILDPACGTAGFLISSYKHIMNKSKSPKGKKLTALERKKLSNNLVGYDISPDMTRISLVNMYLHNFTNPQIHEYDTLSSEDKWNEFYDVILANPPFFSPKGGIQPHSRFGVDSKRAEVLFVDYIIQHLSQNGRAGIIVPEGIIFQTARAYKALRKKLVEDCLVGVISLPAGVFQPYSGVKTSILVLDKKLHRNTEEIYFAQIENDGFSLTAQRTKIASNDIPTVFKQIRNFEQRVASELQLVTRNKVVNNDFQLSQSHYADNSKLNSSHPIVNLGSVLIEKPVYGSGARKAPFNQQIRYLRISDIREDGTLKDNEIVSPSVIESQYFLKPDDFLIARSASVGRTYLHKHSSLQCQFAGYLIKFPLDRTKIIPKFLFYLTKSNRYNDWINRFRKDGTISNINAKEYTRFSFPLPPIEIQQEIVHELDSYQKIIAGARQVVENYKPNIDIDPRWLTAELSDVTKIQNGFAFRGDDYTSHGIRVIRITNVQKGQIIDDNPKFHAKLSEQDHKRFSLHKNDILISLTGNVGRVGKLPYDLEPAYLNQRVCKIQSTSTSLLPEYLYFILNSDKFENDCRTSSTGVAQKNLSTVWISNYKIPLPPIEIQQEIVQELEEYQETVDRNKQFVEIYTKKIQERIAKVWGE